MQGNIYRRQTPCGGSRLFQIKSSETKDVDIGSEVEERPRNGAGSRRASPSELLHCILQQDKKQELKNNESSEETVAISLGMLKTAEATKSTRKINA